METVAFATALYLAGAILVAIISSIVNSIRAI